MPGIANNMTPASCSYAHALIPTSPVPSSLSVSVVLNFERIDNYKTNLQPLCPLPGWWSAIFLYICPHFCFCEKNDSEKKRGHTYSSIYSSTRTHI